MTYLEALLEAESALRRRLGWYSRRALRTSWKRARQRAAELERAIDRVQELIAAARETGL